MVAGDGNGVPLRYILGAVFKNVSIVEKIKIEAPYHNLTNGGHISYVELDGDPSENYEVYENIEEFFAKDYRTISEEIAEDVLNQILIGLKGQETHIFFL